MRGLDPRIQLIAFELHHHLDPDFVRMTPVFMINLAVILTQSESSLARCPKIFPPWLVPLPVDNNS
jgi:hypothetical protein